MNGLDLFSGIGGLSIALESWVRTVAYCENDRYAQAVLLSRMSEGQIPLAPIWDDVRTLTSEDLPKIDIIFGGFPCQDISVAGDGAGLEGKRSGLFFEIIRLVKEIRPDFVFLENVPAITLRGLERIALEFASIRYDCRWGILSAFDVGAPHLRERWFLLAHACCKQLREQSGRSSGAYWEDSTITRSNGSKKSLADTIAPGLERFGEGLSGFSSWWTIEPDVGRVAHGIQNRVDRLKCLGNAVVPQQAKEAFKRLMGLK